MEGSKGKNTIYSRLQLWSASQLLGARDLDVSFDVQVLVSTTYLAGRQGVSLGL